MGTETGFNNGYDTLLLLFVVKLNNPLMGTETNHF